jgi:hypothetical protein
MINIDITNLSSVQEIKKTLTQIQDDDDFKWLKPIVSFSLDESVIVYLNNHEPDSSKFVTLDLKEHITEVTHLINNCNQKRVEIFDIESQALVTAIELIQIINSISSEKKLDQLNLKASLKISEEISEDEYNQALDTKFSNIQVALKTKIALHNQPGNPLNYGERVKYIRKIYSDNIKNIYERLIAIKRTLKYSYNLDTRPLPNYLKVANNLDKLVWWMRDVIYKFEKLEQYDYTLQKSISLSKYAISQGIDPNEFLKKFRTDGVCEITISEQDFIISGTKERMRILGVAANVIGWYDQVTTNPVGSWQNDQLLQGAMKSNNDTKRENMLFYCEVTPPEQNPTLDLDLLYDLSEEEELKLIENLNGIDKSSILNNIVDRIEGINVDKNGRISVRYKPTNKTIDNIIFPKKLIFGELNPIHKSSINSNLNFSFENSIKNASAEGIWKLTLNNVSFDKDLRDTKLEGVKDFTLTFKISIRKF